jgi:hypothetical protein
VVLIGATGLLSALATLVNPRFTKIIGYVVDLMTDRPSQGLIEEWQSPTPSGIANTAFFILILIVMLVLIFSRYRPTPTDALLIVGFLWLAWAGSGMVWFGMVTMPIWRRYASLPMKKPSFEPQHNWLNAVWQACCLCRSAVQPWFVEPAFTAAYRTGSGVVFRMAADRCGTPIKL